MRFEQKRLPATHDRPSFSYTTPLLTDMTYAQPRSVYRRRRWGVIMVRELMTIGLIVLVLYSMVDMFTPRFLVEGNSMEPNFHSNERIIVSRLDYMFTEPQRGHVVVFEHEDDTFLIKRVIGLPGEIITMRSGKVFVDDHYLDENYIGPICNASSCQDREWVLGEQEYFVLGDNRNESMDSHNFGPIHITQIVGRVRVRYYPLNDFSWVIP